MVSKAEVYIKTLRGWKPTSIDQIIDSSEKTYTVCLDEDPEARGKLFELNEKTNTRKIIVSTAEIAEMVNAEEELIPFGIMKLNKKLEKAGYNQFSLLPRPEYLLESKVSVSRKSITNL